MINRFLQVLLSVALATLTSTARADWVNFTGAEVAPKIAEIYVNGDGVRVALEVRTVERRMRIDRHSPCAGTVNPWTGARAPQAPDDKRVLYAELFYAFTSRRPESLTMSPPMNADDVPVASIGMIVQHRNVPVIDFRYFAGPTTLNLDWTEPWYSRFDSPNLTRHHRYPRMSFLYAEPYEIRHEALVRVRDAATLTDEQAAALTGQLLTNVYRAFDFRGETQVYDRLAKTVDGPLLEQVYLDQRRSLRVARAGGAEARVKAVNVDSAVASHVAGTGADFRVLTRWNIVGRVRHWRHVHQRANRYEAQLTLSASGGAWKITGFKVLEQERLPL